MMVSNGLKSWYFILLERDAWNLFEQEENVSMVLYRTSIMMYVTFTHPLPSTFTLVPNL